MTPLELLLKVESCGLRLEVDCSDLLVRPSRKCPREFADMLLANQAALLELLAVPVLIVRSDALHGATVLWTATERHRDVLMKHGAWPGSIWTYAELDCVVRLPADVSSLNCLASTKNIFQGTIVELRTSPNTAAKCRSYPETNSTKTRSVFYRRRGGHYE